MIGECNVFHGRRLKDWLLYPAKPAHFHLRRLKCLINLPRTECCSVVIVSDVLKSSSLNT